MSDLLRRYESSECRAGDGYPHVWHRCSNCTNGIVLDEFPNGDGSSVKGPSGRRCGLCRGSGSVKQLIRDLAENRCERCGHPFDVGAAHEWAEGGEDGDGRPASVAELNQLLMEVDPPPLRRSARKQTLWSPCDERCTHLGKIRIWAECEGSPDDDEWFYTEALLPVGPMATVNHIQAPWRVLTVHHLNEVKSDLRWWNLCALCQRCHLEVQGKVNMAQVWPHEHSEWFKPHAAGFYAATYLGQDLDREATMARLDELLDLERLVAP